MTSRTILTKSVLAGGGIAGLLDILFAISFAAWNGMPPGRLLQTVASGILGNAAFSGGFASALLGLALHFALSWLWAALFLAALWRTPRIALRPVSCGIAFGCMVFLVMRLVVLPLSAFPRAVTFAPLATVLDLMSHTLLFGVPISVFVGAAWIRRSGDSAAASNHG